VQRTRDLLVLLALAALAGCEGEQSDETSATTSTVKRPARIDPTADMVTAVSPSKTPGPVQLKFILGDRPQVGRPLEVEFAVLPLKPVDRVAARFSAGAGLELRHGEQMAAIENPEPGAAITHKITIVPQQDGIFFVSATVHADSPTESISRTFSIPIIAGTGAPPPAEDGSAATEKK
jgi:hypothetical protein